jgi:hypothetical protein
MRTILASLLFVTACAGTATYSASGTIYTPDLVEVEPGVQVVADYDDSVFYSDNYYWRNDGGRWYRSSYHDHGWVVAEPPPRVRGIREPARYRHYRPAGYQPKAGRPAKNYHPAPSQPPAYRPAPSQPEPYKPAPSHEGRPDKRDDHKDHDKDHRRDKDDHRDHD